MGKRRIAVLVVGVVLACILSLRSTEALTQSEKLALESGVVLMTRVDSRPVTVMRTWGGCGDVLVRDSLTLQKVWMEASELRYPTSTELTASIAVKSKSVPRPVVVNSGGGCFISAAGINYK